MTSKMGEWYDSAAKGTAALWASTSEWVSKKWGELGNFMTDVVNKFPKSFEEAKTMALGFVNNVKDKFNKAFPELYNMLEQVFNKVSGVVTGLLDSITKTASDSWNWIKEKTGFGDKKAASTQTAAAATTTTAPTTTAAPSATPGATPASSTATKSQPSAIPEKKGLTAAEKAAAMETVATNTKYTNDLLIAQQKMMDGLQRQMLQKLDMIASHSMDTASAAKKTAKNTG
jgi:phage-related protein